MSIIRNRITKKFTTIPNRIIIDGNLTHGAFRVYSYLLSKPDGWKVINTDIQEQLNIKQSQTMANYWKELISTGWISRCRIKDNAGKIIGGYDYELNESPILPSNQSMEPAILGNIHNVEKPYYGKIINRENPQYINNTKEQEQNKTDLSNTYPPTPKNGQNKTEGVIVVLPKQIKQISHEFTEAELQAINSWVKYKSSKATPLTAQQMELTLNILKAHKAAKFDIVYMIHQSITGNYRKIMDPTNACIAKMVKVINSKYQSIDYIIPQTENEKNELWNYLKCCYINKIDPRTGNHMTKEQIFHIGRHFKLGLSNRINQDKYIYIHEIETGISLLEQAIG